MIPLAAGQSIQGVAGSAAAITYSIVGDAKTTSDAFQVFLQGQLPAAAASLYTSPALTSSLVGRMFFRNTTAGIVTMAIYLNGVAGSNQIFAGSIPANGSATYGQDGWKIYDSSGIQLYVGAIGPAGATGATGPTGPTGATGPAANAFGVVTGNAGTATADAAADTIAITGSGSVSTTATDTPDGLVIANAAATTAVAGNMSALDKLKLDNTWIDVTANSIALVLTTNTATQNVTAINAILAAAPAGSVIFFPGGTYNFNAAWTVPSKAFVYQGVGGGLTGGYTILAWTSNVSGDFITIPNLIWYSKFKELCFVSSGVTQTAGAVVNINGNAFTDFEDCTFGAIGGGFLFNLMSGPANTASLPLSDNSWNQSVISNCIGTGYKGTAIIVNSRGSSLVIENSTFNGQWGTTSQCAVAGLNGKWVGALQFTACDFIGHVNNLLFDPTAASSEVCASVHVTNTYFDLSLGSCIKVSGTGATVRMKFDNCTFTTSNGGTGFSAVELAGSFVYATGGQDIAFVNCNIYNTFATTGTTNGVLITNAADVSFLNVKIAGWTNGYNITPMALNKTNVQIIGGTVGPSGGYGGNALGFAIGAGAYKGLQIRANNCVGNTAPYTLGAVTVLEPSMFAITENAGINPRGVEVRPVASPVTATTYTNTSGFRVLVMHKNATAHTAVTVNGLVYTVAWVAGAITTFVLEPGGSISFTGGTSTSWSWNSL